MKKLPVYVEIEDLKAQEVLTALRMAGVNLTDFITEAFKTHKMTESKTLAKVVWEGERWRHFTKLKYQKATSQIF